MAWAELEVEDGVEEDDPLLLDEELLLLEDAPLLADEELLLPDEELLLPDPPEDECTEDDAELVLADALAELCVEPGKVKASPPATATPSTPVPAVTARSRFRARSRFTTAVTVRGSLLFIMTPSRKLTLLDSPNDLWLGFPVHLRRL